MQFTPSDLEPITLYSMFVMIGSGEIEKILPMMQPGQNKKQEMKEMAKRFVSGFEKFSFSADYKRIQAWIGVKDFLFTKSGEILEFDEAKLRALVKKGIEKEAPGPQLYENLQQARSRLLHLAPRAISMMSLSADSKEAKTASASPFAVGAVSLMGSLVLIGVVAGAFITRSGRKAREIQAGGAAGVATEMTSQEVA